MEDRTPALALPLALIRTDHHEPSIFHPARLLRAARRQRGLVDGVVPAVCLLDPDGDVVRTLQRTERARRSATWACYHTELWETAVAGQPVGVIGNAVGAPFAVLVAEELFAAGCQLVVSVTSAGQLDHSLVLPATILVERAWRGEGTSYAYLPAADVVNGDAVLLTAVAEELARAGIAAIRGGTWTTDAPFRETRSAVVAATAAGLAAIDMETAGLYAFSQACRVPILCFALVTNQMAQTSGDFEKGPGDGVAHVLALVAAAIRAWNTIGPSTRWTGLDEVKL